MGRTHGTAVEDRAAEQGRICQQAVCPMCGGVMIPLGEHSRCSRCSFDLCVGCEGPAAFDVGAFND